MYMKKACVILLCVCVGVSIGGTFPAWGAEPEFKSLVYQLAIPEDMGTVEDRWEGSSDKLFVLVQDAHVSLEVQLHIAHIVEYLLKTYNIDLVNIEGADEGKINFQELRELEPRDVVEKVSVEFLKECRINGAVYAKINSEKDFLEYGTEDKSAYLENYKRYLAVIENSKETLDYLVGVKDAMMKQKKNFLSPSLVEIVDVDLLFKDNDVSLVSYFKVILKYAKKLGIDLIDYPSVSQLIEVVLSADAENKFRNVDSEKLLDELMAINKKIKERLATSPREKQFLELFDRIMLLRDILVLKVVPSDYMKYTKDPASYGSYAMTERIHALFPAYDTAPLMKLDGLLKSAKEFYERADERSRIIFHNSLANLKAENRTKAVIVSGGFHTEEIAALCKENNISYVRIMPLVTNDKETVDYTGRMLALKSELITDDIHQATKS